MPNNLKFSLNDEQKNNLFHLETDAHHGLAVAGRNIANAIKEDLVPSDEELETYKAETIRMETVTRAMKWVYVIENNELNLNWMLEVQRGCGNKLASEWFSDFMRIVMLNN